MIATLPRTETPPAPAPPPAQSRWPHRWAGLLCVATFPLVFVGGLVTSTEAGMAVPDWPNTYGYNLLLYPWRTWLFGPWDLFIEHGHRLLATGVGLLAIGAMASSLWGGAPRAVRRLAALALGLVVFQGVLGGLRVVLVARELAMVHGCVGPLFFGVTAALWARSAPWWDRSVSASPLQKPAFGGSLLSALAPLTFAQIVLGAWIRHAPADPSPRLFATVVLAHVALATTLLLISVALWATYSKSRPWEPAPLWVVRGIAAVATAQFCLGLGSWLVRYALPGWAQSVMGTLSTGATVQAAQAGGFLQSTVLSGHVAGGALLFALSLVGGMLVGRQRGSRDSATEYQVS